MPDFDALFKKIDQKSSKDKHSAAYRAGDLRIKSRIPFAIPTCIPELDVSLGRPGWPAGRIIELYGLEACGKTTAAVHALAKAQRMGGGGVYIDTEKTYDPERMTDLGVDVEGNFAVLDADTTDAAFRCAENTMISIKEVGFNKPFVVILDSVTGSQNEYASGREIGEEARVGQDARVIRGAMRKITPGVAESKVLFFLINHAISTASGNPYQKQYKAAGGNTIKLLGTVRIEFRQGTAIKDPQDKDRRLGQNIYINLEKLKGSRLEWPTIKARLLNDCGFDTEGSLLEAGLKTGFIEHTKGSKSYYLGDKEFSKDDWHTVVMENGGVDTFYDTFLSWSLEAGKIRPWGGSLNVKQ